MPSPRSNSSDELTRCRTVGSTSVPRERRRVIYCLHHAPHFDGCSISFLLPIFVFLVSYRLLDLIGTTRLIGVLGAPTYFSFQFPMLLEHPVTFVYVPSQCFPARDFGNTAQRGDDAAGVFHHPKDRTLLTSVTSSVVGSL